jgi:predicted dehydrogenase
VGVIGCGYWGKNHVRNFNALGALAAVCDASEANRALASETARSTPIFSSVDAMLRGLDLDGVVVATPAETHFEIAQTCLSAGLDLLVEKPLSLSIKDGKRLVSLAEEKKRILMVGHLLNYHPGVIRLLELIRSGELGSIRYIYSNRLNLGKIRREENILWSFAPHDISVILRIIGASPFQVIATGGSYVQPNIVDVTVTQLLFDNGVRAHIFVSWLHPYKEQRLVIVGSQKMAAFDDLAKNLVVFDQRVEWRNGQPLPVNGGGTTLSYADGEPLRMECQAFLDAIGTRTPPPTDGREALVTLEVLSAAQRSLVTQGVPVQLPLHDA